jgi:hypothetical protein
MPIDYRQRARVRSGIQTRSAPGMAGTYHKNKYMKKTIKREACAKGAKKAMKNRRAPFVEGKKKHYNL